MDYKKIILYGAILVVALILWNDWQRDFPLITTGTDTTVVNNTQSIIPTTTPTVGISTVPVINHIAHQRPTTIATAVTDAHLVQVKTDVLNVTINTLGGNIEQTQLLQYHQKLDKHSPSVELFSADPNNYYVAQSGLTGSQGPDTQKGQVIYQTSQTSYELTPGTKPLQVHLTWYGNGLTVVKTYTFTPGSYVVQMRYDVSNDSGKTWTGNVYTQLARKPPVEHHSLLTSYATFTGAAVSSPSEHYQKEKFSNFTDSPINQSATNGWAAMIQQYFLTAWVPPAQQNYTYYSSVSGDIYTVGMYSNALTVASGQTATTSSNLYVGPAIASNLDQLSPYLHMTIDYGWLWFIAQFIFWMLKHIYDVVGNWGWSIILVTIVIKIIFYPLSTKSFRSMAYMRRLQPKVAQLKERFGDDKQAMSRAMMDLYRKEKVNPLSGCLPIIIQIPVFIALYWVIMQSVELRHAPWILWVQDLSTHDIYYILPVVMGLLMFVQQKLSPPPPDPTQAKVMMFMPVIFTVLFLGFPSGLVLYWITNTFTTVLHQYYIMYKVEQEEKHKQHKLALKK
ncbi:MAG: membrane protein insertase YidC [Gammaproteobacteria bacterium]|nr:membrane protein insertase YidC [Gammaproteobacteria bacterium]